MRKLRNTIKTITILLVGTLSAWGQEITEINHNPLVIGESISFHSSVLQEERVLNIYLPEGYGVDSLREFPVIYLLDGSMSEDFIHIVGLVQFHSFPWIENLKECIVVGISNVDRRRDFTYPTTVQKDSIANPTNGHSAEFMEFLSKELIPFVKSNYRVTDHSTLIGQSLGGLLAAQILYHHPDLFSRYIIVSPSMWWDNGSLLKQELPSLQGKQVFIAVGKEGKMMVQGANKLHQAIKRSVDPPSLLGFRYLNDKNHGDALHEAVYEAIEFFAGKK